VLLPVLLVFRRRLLAIRRADLPSLILLGIGLAGSQFTYLFAISKIHVAAAILLQYQAPVLIAGYALLYRRERLSPITLTALLAAVSGCYLMVGGYRMELLSMNQSGILSGLASAAAFAWYTVRSEQAMRLYTPWTVLFYALLFAGVVWNILHPPLAAFTASYTAFAWWVILFIGTCGTLLPFGFYNAGIRIISSARASIAATLEPVIAGILAFLFLGEVMEPLQVAGGGMVIAAIILLQMDRTATTGNE
jgi:drug/metabolite transporter (DMT)-like permease